MPPLLAGPLLTALLLAGCGPAPGPEASLVLHVQALTGEETLQLVLLEGLDAQGSEVRCDRVLSTCIADQPALRVVPLDVDGERVDAYRIPIEQAQAQSAAGQAIELPGIPPGTGYLLGVELTRPGRAGEERVGAGCAPLPEIRGGRNDPLPEPIHVTQRDDGCNPGL